MLERVEKPGGLIVFQSGLLTAVGVPHAFTTRVGGVSGPPCDTLNFQPASPDASQLGEPVTPGARSSAPAKDQFPAVVENFKRLAAALGCAGRQVVCVWQVHGVKVCAWPEDAKGTAKVAGATQVMETTRPLGATASVPARSGPTQSPIVVMQADALATGTPSALLAIRTADCVPILLASRDGSAVAAVHAGWRGVVAGVLPAAMRAMTDRFATRPADILAAIGPCISLNHFEVGAEVADAVAGAGLGAFVSAAFAKPHVDLAGAIGHQLAVAGVPVAQIDRSDRCTFRDRAEFFSHRRDQGRTGRMAAVIGTK